MGNEFLGVLTEFGQRARGAARSLALMGAQEKVEILQAMAAALRSQMGPILEANTQDLAAAKEQGMSKALLDRLTLNEARIEDMAAGLEMVAELPDPVGRVEKMWRRPNGLEIGKIRVPLGVIGIIYEARPNVTVDAAGLCLKAGNAVILKGGSEALRSNQAIVDVITAAAQKAGAPEGTIQLVPFTEREATRELMGLDEYIDVLIPRGGANLIRTVLEHSTIPVIETGNGVCHVYVDEGADLAMAQAILVNAKCQRPGVCNAVETLLVHKDVAQAFLPGVAGELSAKGVELRGCSQTSQILPDIGEAVEEDWGAEYLDLILAIKVVDSFEEAIDHINRYGSGHSEAIITRDYRRARLFLQSIDAATVYVNASTRFTDGGQFGLGAEIGISTQKLHARGPMGLEELTTTKYIIYGDGQVRD
ncbi:MAG: glutamate-5-semialdehyde dehydrogenase [Limnochordia bacterium]|jgi:glutamate-5-semialdehyde dehydrogenase